MITQAMFVRFRDNPPRSNSVPPEFLTALRANVLLRYTQQLMDGTAK